MALARQFSTNHGPPFVSNKSHHLIGSSYGVGVCLCSLLSQFGSMLCPSLQPEVQAVLGAFTEQMLSSCHDCFCTRGVYFLSIFLNFSGSGAWNCLLGAWNCLLGVWIGKLGAWNCLLGAWNCLLGVWNCLLGVWICLLGVWIGLLGAPECPACFLYPL